MIPVITSIIEAIPGIVDGFRSASDAAETLIQDFLKKFEEEFREFLKAYDIDWDERYVWD